MADLSTCNSPTCAVTVEGTITQCPKCGGAMRAVREPRARGWILLFLGLFLVVFMAAIAWSVLPSMLTPGERMADGSSFTGTAEEAQTALALFGAVILFGLVAIANGLFIIKTGRQSWAFVAVALAIAAILILLGYWIIGWKPAA